MPYNKDAKITQKKTQLVNKDGELLNEDKREMFVITGQIVFKCSDTIVARFKLQELQEIFLNDSNITVLPETSVEMLRAQEKPIIVPKTEIIKS